MFLSLYNIFVHNLHLKEELNKNKVNVHIIQFQIQYLIT
jgi:hypothetical protein